MDDTHLAVVHLVRDRSTAGAKHAAVEIAVVHAQHHAAYILVVMPTFPHAGIGVLVNEGLKNVIGIAQRTPPGLHIGHYASIKSYALA